MAVSVGTAYVSIIPSTKGFAKAIERDVKPAATGHAMGKTTGKSFSSGFTKSLGGLAAAGGLIAAAVGVKKFATASVQAFRDVGSESMGLQRVLGGTIEEMSTLRGAAQLGGVSTDAMAMGMRTLSRQVYAGGKAFEALGIKTKDANGKIRPTNDILMDVADKFKAMPNGAAKSALALKLFGRSGTEMLPMLNRGSKGIAELEKQTAKYGMTLSKVDQENIKKFVAAQRELKMASEGAKVGLGKALFPALTQIQQALVKIIPPLTLAITPALKALGDIAVKMVQQLSQNMPQVVATVQGFAVTIKTFADKIRENWPTIRDIVSSVASAFQRVAAWLGLAWQWFSKLPTPVKEFTAALVVLTKLGVIGALAGAIRGLAGAFGALNLSLLANPITWIVLAVVAAVAALGAAVWWLWNHNEKFRERMTAIWTDLKKTLTEFKAYWDAEIWPTLKDVVPILAGVMVASFQLISGAMKVVIGVIQFTWDKVKAFIEFLNGTPLGGLITLPGEASPTGNGGGGGFASGGMIPGTGTRDTTPVLTTPGEWVLTRRQVAQVSPARLEAWRQGGPPLGAGSGVQVGQLIINNPKPESASDSLPRSIRKLQHVSAR